MRSGLGSMLVALLLATGCGGGESAQPTVSIDELSADGFDAILAFTTDDDNDAVDIVVDWGDDSPPVALRGLGELATSHRYEGEPGPRVVTITVTDSDGNAVNAGRTLSIGEAPSTTEDPDGPTSTIEDPDGPTTTTDPEGSTTTTSASTTTTTAPPAEQVIQLAPSDARFTETGSGEGSALLNGRTVQVYAITEGFSQRSYANAQLEWSIPAEQIDALGPNPQISVFLQPSWSALLSTGPNTGRAARFDIQLYGYLGSQIIGQGAELVDIGNDDEGQFSGNDPIGFGGVANRSGESFLLRLTVTCSAERGTTVLQIGENSTCDARGSRGTTIDELRVTIRRADG